MPLPLIVTLIVALGDGRDPITGSFVGALREALGSDARVLVRREPESLGDEDAALLGDLLGSRVVVVARWVDARRRVARLRVQTTGRGWSTREVSFEPSDPAEERGRALGLLLKSAVAKFVSSEVSFGLIGKLEPTK